MISDEDFKILIARFERYAAENPRRYNLRLCAFALLGYMYVFLALLALAAIVVSIVLIIKVAPGGTVFFLIKLAIPVLILLAIVLRVMWVRLETPEGLEIKRKDNPTLFATIEDIRRRVGAPRAHKVLLVDQLQAAIVQVPRLGVFGWQKNYLLLGLPLLQLLPTDEFKAVLAHEFGHLSGAHGRLGAWIYRLRTTWSRLNETLQQNDQIWGSALFVPFFGWFAPRFAAISFVKARQQEYEADRLAARAVGAGQIAGALVRIEIKADDLINDFWPSVMAAADTEPSPDRQPFRQLLSTERRQFMSHAPEQLNAALARETSTTDTHPCLKDRLTALAQTPEFPPAFAQSAAETLLGPSLESLLEHFDRHWSNAVANWWSQRHEYMTTGKARLLDLQSRDARNLNDTELFELARCTEEFGDEHDSLALYEMLLNRDPDHLEAIYNYGCCLLRKQDIRGIDLVERAMERKPSTISQGCMLIVNLSLIHI